MRDRLPPLRRGFALFEVMVALALLAGAAVALAGLFGIAGAANRRSRERSLGVLLASQKMEQILGLAWCYGPDGDERADLVTDLSVYPETGGGSGLSEGALTSLVSNTSGFVDYLDADGAWIGTGASPPAGTAFVRRWSIRVSPDHPADTLIVRVVVVRLGIGSSAVPAPDTPGVVELTCARSRRGA